MFGICIGCCWLQRECPAVHEIPQAQCGVRKRQRPQGFRQTGFLSFFPNHPRASTWKELGSWFSHLKRYIFKQPFGSFWKLWKGGCCVERGVSRCFPSATSLSAAPVSARPAGAAPACAAAWTAPRCGLDSSWRGRLAPGKQKQKGVRGSLNEGVRMVMKNYEILLQNRAHKMCLFVSVLRFHSCLPFEKVWQKYSLK